MDDSKLFAAQKVRDDIAKVEKQLKWVTDRLEEKDSPIWVDFSATYETWGKPQTENHRHEPNAEVWKSILRLMLSSCNQRLVSLKEEYAAI